MAWDKLHKVTSSNGKVECTPGYMTETITLGAASATVVTSVLPGPYKSDMTILFKPSSNLANDITISVEHSVDGTNFIKIGQFDATAAVTGNISNDMSKIGIIDLSATGDASGGAMFLYALDSHGVSRHIRFSAVAVADESSKTGIFTVIPHF